jgi:hypothetical protein
MAQSARSLNLLVRVEENSGSLSFEEERWAVQILVGPKFNCVELVVGEWKETQDR